MLYNLVEKKSLSNRLSQAKGRHEATTDHDGGFLSSWVFFSLFSPYLLVRPRHPLEAGREFRPKHQPALGRQARDVGLAQRLVPGVPVPLPAGRVAVQDRLTQVARVRELGEEKHGAAGEADTLLTTINFLSQNGVGEPFTSCFAPPPPPFSSSFPYSFSFFKDSLKRCRETERPRGGGKGGIVKKKERGQKKKRGGGNTHIIRPAHDLALPRPRRVALVVLGHGDGVGLEHGLELGRVRVRADGGHVEKGIHGDDECRVCSFCTCTCVRCD